VGVRFCVGGVGRWEGRIGGLFGGLYIGRHGDRWVIGLLVVWGFLVWGGVVCCGVGGGGLFGFVFVV